MRAEPKEIQQEKRMAWLRAQNVSNAHVKDLIGEVEMEDDTDLEDEGVPNVFVRNEQGVFVPELQEQLQQQARNKVSNSQDMVVMETQDAQVSSTSDDSGPRVYNRFGVRVEPWDHNVEFDAADRP